MKKEFFLISLVIVSSANAAQEAEITNEKIELAWRIPTPLGDVKMDSPDKSARELVEKIGDATIKTIEGVSGGITHIVEQSGIEVGRTIETAGGNTVKTIVKVGNDVAVTYTKAWKDSEVQAIRSLKDATDAGAAATNFTANQLRSALTTTQNAEKRLREGKIIDAVWGLGIEPLQGAEANFARATQESKVIAAAASSAAAIYGGPGGAAAYAAWSTYRNTGNADMAFRAGLLAGVSAQAGGTISNLPTENARDVITKAATAGAAGGIAVAAAGGDEQAITEAFLKSAGNVVIQVGRSEAEAYAPQAAEAWKTTHCISARDVDCISRREWVKDAKGKILYDKYGNPRFNTRNLPQENYVGRWSKIDPNTADGKVKSFLAKASQLPKGEIIPLMENKWVLTWNIGKDANIQDGAPTVALTHVGNNPPFVATLSYGQQDGTPDLADRTPSYFCTGGGIDRIVTITKLKSGCTSIYQRSDGIQQVVWRSKYDKEVCNVKSAAFVRRLQSKGLKCKSL